MKMPGVQGQKQLYQIGMFANLNHVTVKTLRYYDETGLLKPAYVDNQTCYRYYTTSQMADLSQILAWKSMGFSLEEIRELQSGKSEKRLLQEKKQQILKQLADITAKLAQVESCLADINLEPKEHVLIKSIPEVTVAYMRRRIESYDGLAGLMPEMEEEMCRCCCEYALPEYCFTLYPEAGYKEEQILVEVCQAVTRETEGTKKLAFKIYPAIPTAACLMHRGSYDTLPASFEKLLRYVEDNGMTICGSIRESYIDGAWNKDTADEWLTEIQIPVCRCARQAGMPPV